MHHRDRSEATPLFRVFYKRFHVPVLHILRILYIRYKKKFGYFFNENMYVNEGFNEAGFFF